MGFLIPPHPLTNFEIQKHYKNEPRLNGVFSRKNLPKKNKGWGIYNKTWWISRCWRKLDCFIFKKKMKFFIILKYIPEQIKVFIEEFPGNKNIKANIFWVQENNSIMCRYFCIGFIDFMLAGKKLTDYTNFFSPHDLKKTII